jgi:hypothetical protein
MAYDVSTCPGPDGTPIPLVHFADIAGAGMLAVSIAEGKAMFTTPKHPLDFDVNPIAISAEDRKELAALLLREDF